MNKLQICQNKSLKYIHSVKYPQLISSEGLHNRSNIKPINITLHEQAKAIWDKVDMLDVDGPINYSYPDQDLIRTIPYHFKSSRDAALSNDPQPIYTFR